MNMNLKNYEVFGFDLDLTLASYNNAELYIVSYHGLANFLVTKLGYSPQILDDYDKYACFCSKGLLLDVELGNTLKLDCEGHIVRGSHGTRMLSRDEISNIYGNDRKLKEFPVISPTLVSTDHFVVIENGYVAPAAVLFARIIDSLDKQNGGPLNKYNLKVWTDIKCALSSQYNHTHFADGTSHFFQQLQADPGKYLHECSTKLKTWLKSLKKVHNKITFLMTSSYVHFASFVLTYVLGEDWKQYFDIVLTHARKPNFFTDGHPFYHLQNDKENGKVKTLEMNGIYSQGNVQTFVEFLKQASNSQHPKVVYFGDSLRSDSIPSKNIAKWDVVFVSNELGAEYQGQEEFIGQTFPKSNNIETSDDGEPLVKKRKRDMCHDNSRLTAADREVLTSPQWGSIFHADESLSTTESHTHEGMNTLFGAKMISSCDFVIPHIEYITEISIDNSGDIAKNKNSGEPNTESDHTCVFYPYSPPRATHYSKDLDIHDNKEASNLYENGSGCNLTK